MRQKSSKNVDIRWKLMILSVNQVTWLRPTVSGHHQLLRKPICMTIRWMDAENELQQVVIFREKYIKNLQKMLIFDGN